MKAFLSFNSRTHTFIVSILFIAAFGIRFYHINEPPARFHPTRQYRSAIIARGYFFETLQSTSDWQSKVAIINKDKEGILEPPIMELLAFLAYCIAGAEHLWIPRILSVILWLGGGVFLYALTRDLLSRAAAILSTAFYLFLPFGILASQSFQPEPLMIFLFLSSIFAMSRYHLQPSRTKLVIVTALSALAILVKPVCLFAIFAAFIMANISRQGIRKTVTNPHLVLFCIISLFPTVLYYWYGIFVAGFLRGQAEGSFIPSLYFSSSFWLGWLRQINSVVGYTALIAALLGVLLFRDGWPKALLVGLWLGYAFFGLTFNYHIHTHDYYQLQFIPIVALSIAPLGVLVFSRLAQTCVQWHWRLVLLGVLLFASLLYIREVRGELGKGKSNLQQMQIAEEIGATINHSSNTIFLDFAYGKLLKYHGGISGKPWPQEGDLRAEKLRGQQVLTAQERLDTLITQLSPEYFIVTSFSAYESQEDLNQYLTESFPIVAQNRDYLIFDLRSKNN